MNINIGNRGKISINGVSYEGDNVVIENNNVTIDGVKQDGKHISKSKKIDVLITGDVETVSAGSGSVTARNITNASTGSGDVKADIITTVNTSSGDVEAEQIQGDVRTSSGDVEAGSIGGSTTTSSGDITTKKRLF